jgi:hypothetical protein
MQFHFLAVLTYEHLDNGMFLTAFARSLAKKKKRGIILHGDSEYTERIIQTGVMREDATIRAVKDLNHRLVALLADQGVPAVSLNGYQKSLVKVENNQILIDSRQLYSLPGETVILLSNLAESTIENKPVPLPLNHLALSLQKEIRIPITVFSKKKDAEFIDHNFPFLLTPNQDSHLSAIHVPEAFRNFHEEITLTSPSLF